MNKPTKPGLYLYVGGDGQWHRAEVYASDNVLVFSLNGLRYSVEAFDIWQEIELPPIPQNCLHCGGLAKYICGKCHHIKCLKCGINTSDQSSRESAFEIWNKTYRS